MLISFRFYFDFILSARQSLIWCICSVSISSEFMFDYRMKWQFDEHFLTVVNASKGIYCCDMFAIKKFVKQIVVSLFYDPIAIFIRKFYFQKNLLLSILPAHTASVLEKAICSMIEKIRQEKNESVQELNAKR